MSQPEAISFTPIEVRSYLPGGWSLKAAEGQPEDSETWSATLVDIADMEWPLSVTPKEVDRHGRIEALRRAIDRIYREALG